MTLSLAEARHGAKLPVSLAPSKSWAQSLFCYTFSDVLASSALTNRTIGYGAGASAGAGFGVLGWYSSISIQGVADPQGSAGVAINFGAGPFVLGLGAQAGGQASLSTATSINDLSGDAMDVSGSAGPFGLDVSHAPGGSTTGTVTVGPGVGTRMVSVGGSHTWVPLSVNCK